MCIALQVDAILGSDQCRLLPFVLIEEKQKKREPHKRIMRRKLLWAEKEAIREIRSVSSCAAFLFHMNCLKCPNEQVCATCCGCSSPKVDAEAGIMAAETIVSYRSVNRFSCMVFASSTAFEKITWGALYMVRAVPRLLAYIFSIYAWPVDHVNP